MNFLGQISKKWVVVYNPKSGASRGKAIKKELLKRASGIDFCAVETTKERGWRENFARHAHECPNVIAIGGDGTLSEVIGALVETGSGLTTLSKVLFVPGGRGNDFCRSVYGSQALKSFDGSGDFWSWAEEQSWSAAWMDAACATLDGNSRLFLNMASVGYGAEVVEQVHSGKKGLFSGTGLVYQVEGAKALLRSPEIETLVESDGREIYRGPLFAVFAGNGKSNGTGLVWNADAELHDGMLDGILFARPSFLTMLGALGAVKKGGNPSFPHVRSRFGRLKLRTVADTERLSIEVDGEFIGRARELEIFCLPQAFRAFVPAQ